MRLTMKQIKADAAKRRAVLLAEYIANDYTIIEMAIIHGVTPQAMGKTINKAKIDRAQARKD